MSLEKQLYVRKFVRFELVVVDTTTSPPPLSETILEVLFGYLTGCHGKYQGNQLLKDHYDPLYVRLEFTHRLRGI